MSVEDWSDQDLLDELNDIDHGLSDVDMDLIDSFTTQFEYKRRLSPKQRIAAYNILKRRGVVDDDD